MINTMGGVRSVVKRNLKIISRSKLSSFLLLLAPLLLVFLVGTAFSSDSLHNLGLSVHASEYTNLTESIISRLEGSGFLISRQDSHVSCVSAVTEGLSHACIVFPSGMEVGTVTEPILIHVDDSRVNLAHSLITKIDSGISEEASEIGLALTTDLLSHISDAQSSLPDPIEQLDLARGSLGDIESAASGDSEDDLDAIIADIGSIADDIEAIVTEEDVSGIINDLDEVELAITELSSGQEDQFGDIAREARTSKGHISEARSSLASLEQRLARSTVTDSEQVALPIKTEIRELTGGPQWKSLFPTLIALIILLSSIILASNIVLSERKSRANFRNFMTPTKDLSFIFGSYVTCLIILLLQMIILFVGAYYITGLGLSDVYTGGVVAGILFISSSVFLFLGMLIGYVFKSDETTILAAISVALLLIFFSNLILPSEFIEGGFSYVSVYNPLLITDTMLKQVMLHSAPLYSLYLELGLLLGASIVLVFLTLFARKLTKRFV